MNLLQDWQSRQNGNQEHDDSWYIDLLHLHHSKDDLKKIFNFSPKSQLAEERFSSFFKESSKDLYWTPRQENKLDISILKSEARVLVNDVMAFLRDEGDSTVADQLGFIERFRIVSRNTIELEKNNPDNLNSIYIDAIEDAFRDIIDEPYELTFPLKESAYLLTADLEVTRYLIAPLTSHPFAFDSAYEFWKSGGLYCFIEGECLIAQRWD